MWSMVSWSPGVTWQSKSSPAQVPVLQKEIIQLANRHGKTVITATQMLDSMIHNPRPTRAEASDVANAIFDGTDAVMLSGETASGSYPLEAVQMMAQIVDEAESHYNEWGSVNAVPDAPNRDDAISMTRAARELAHDRNVSAIAVFTQTGKTAILMSKARPQVPILAFTPDPVIFNRLGLLWGVTSFLVPFAHTVEGMISIVENAILSSTQVRTRPAGRSLNRISDWHLPPTQHGPAAYDQRKSRPGLISPHRRMMATFPWIHTDRLAELIERPNEIRLVDCRFDLAKPAWGRESFMQAHIPGATFADLNLDLAGPITQETGRHPLPEPAQFVDTLATWGIEPGRLVVTYDTNGGAFADRLWWLLKAIGHENVQILDGGFPKWQAEGRPVQSGIEPVDPTTYRYPARFDPAMFLTTAQLQEIRNDPAYLLIDARSPERFQGLVEPIDPVAGHIPGAVNRLHALNLAPDGTLKPPDQLRQEFTNLIGSHPLGPCRRLLRLRRHLHPSPGCPRIHRLARRPPLRRLLERMDPRPLPSHRHREIRSGMKKNSPAF